MDPFTLGSLGIGLVGSVGKMFGRGAANRRLGGLEAKMPRYQESPIAAQRLGMAQALINARMPGAAAAERNIYQTQANQISAAERAATDPNQLLLAGAGATGQAQQAFSQLSQAENADYQRRYGNLAAAQEAQMAEQQRVYEDQLRRYQMQAQIESAQQENRQNTMGDISNLGFAGAYLGQQGFFNRTPTTAMGRSGIPSANAPIFSRQGLGQGFGFSPSATTGVPSNLLNMGYGQNNPYYWSQGALSSLGAGYGNTTQPYSWMRQ